MTYLVILYLTMMDGSHHCFPEDCKSWPRVQSEYQCKQMLLDEVAKMREQYENSEIRPSTFITGCVAQ